MEPLSLSSMTLAGLLAALPAPAEPVSQSVINTYITPAIAGQWEIELNNEVAQASECRELYNFGANNDMWAVSGDEWTYSKYMVSYQDDGLPIIALSTIYDNNAVDCSGNQVDQTGETFVGFLNHENNEMQWCVDPEGSECFMSFHRMQP